MRVYHVTHGDRYLCRQATTLGVAHVRLVAFVLLRERYRSAPHEYLLAVKQMCLELIDAHCRLAGNGDDGSGGSVGSDGDAADATDTEEASWMWQNVVAETLLDITAATDPESQVGGREFVSLVSLWGLLGAGY
jgi:hypothetical protein